MLKVTLVYPYFRPSNDNSIFRSPPLGLGYLAAALKKRGYEVELVDCTFMGKDQAARQICNSTAEVVGFYSMFSMKKTTLQLAQAVRDSRGGDCLLVAGGPLPSWAPESFLGVFDAVAVGEGEETMVELVDCVARDAEPSGVKGLVLRDGKRMVETGKRGFVADLDGLAFPARELFDNNAYKKYYQQSFGYTTTSMMTSRGCPFSCDFCSRPIFGTNLRTRSAQNIAQEVEQVKALGYERIWFADDCFTANRSHLLDVCREIYQRHLDVGWECLSRVDTMDEEVARKMMRAGCIRVFFGIESGNDSVLATMNKKITVSQAKRAVSAARAGGLQVGAFFIVGYPGETDRTVLDTVRFASSLPLDYLSFTLPYPIPGTPLYERVKHKGVAIVDWEEPKNYRLIRHKLLYTSGFSETKLKFAIAKAQAQFHGRRYLGNRGYRVFGEPFEVFTDWFFKTLP
jgi:anaerobic magnesium-protoporphyrin IX monomethyl ester cyclase